MSDNKFWAERDARHRAAMAEYHAFLKTDAGRAVPWSARAEIAAMEICGQALGVLLVLLPVLFFGALLALAEWLHK
jgi:hypothetical protein